MPIPTPNSGESEQEFISRCMANSTMVSEYPEEDQRAAVCYDSWRNKEEAEEEAAEEEEAEEEAEEEQPEIELQAEQLPEERTMDFVISSEDADRDGDRVMLSGWQLKNFMKNPVFLLFHDKQNFPVGKFTKIWSEGNNLLGRVRFMDENKYERADLSYYMFKEGFMNTVSVGFRPLEPFDENVKENEYGGHDFFSQELFEVSGVNVPANPQALAVRKEYEKEQDGVVWKLFNIHKVEPDEAKAKLEETKVRKLTEALKVLNKSIKGVTNGKD